MTDTELAITRRRVEGNPLYDAWAKTMGGEVFTDRQRSEAAFASGDYDGYASRWRASYLARWPAAGLWAFAVPTARP